jgi:hypothetical protein
MNVNLIPKLVEMWLAVNLAALLVLAVMSYVSSVFILDWLESFDRWLSAREHGNLESKKKLHEVRSE